MTAPQVLTVPLPSLIHDPDNPNMMTEDEKAGLTSAIEKHGMVQPILVSPEESGAVPGEQRWHIVDGHHRAECAGRAGLTEILAVVWDGSDEMRRVFGLSMNKRRGELNLASVQRILQDLSQDGWTNVALTETGFSEAEVTDLLKAVNTTTSEDIMEGAMEPVDDTPAEARPLALELTFATAEDLKRAKRGLRKAAGKSGELGDGLLALLRGEGN